MPGTIYLKYGVFFETCNYIHNFGFVAIVSVVLSSNENYCFDLLSD